jgi:hypothetical protein
MKVDLLRLAPYGRYQLWLPINMGRPRLDAGSVIILGTPFYPR